MFTRQDSDFFKMLATLVKQLPEGKIKQEIIALADGYFLEAKCRQRSSDKINIGITLLKGTKTVQGVL